MTDIYKAPECDLSASSPEEEEVNALKSMFREQRFILAPLLAFISIILFFAPLFFSYGEKPLWVFLFPAVAVGMLLKYTCRLVQIKHRIISSAIVLLIVFLLMSLSDFVSAVSLALFSFTICFALSKRTLYGEQTRLLYKLKIGKLKI